MEDLHKSVIDDYLRIFPTFADDNAIIAYSHMTFRERMSMLINYTYLKGMYEKGSIDRYFLKLILNNNELRVMPVHDDFFHLINVLRRCPLVFRCALRDHIAIAFKTQARGRDVSERIMIQDILHFFEHSNLVVGDEISLISGEDLDRLFCKCSEFARVNAPVTLVQHMYKMLLEFCVETRAVEKIQKVSCDLREASAALGREMDPMCTQTKLECAIAVADAMAGSSVPIIEFERVVIQCVSEARVCTAAALVKMVKSKLPNADLRFIENFISIFKHTGYFKITAEGISLADAIPVKIVWQGLPP